MYKKSMVQWVNALKSDKYKICSGQLRKTIDGESHYCLWGVFCDIMDPDGWKEDERFGWTHHGEPYYPPESLLKKHKIKSKFVLDAYDEWFDEPKKRPKIIRYIRKNYLEL